MRMRVYILVFGMKIFYLSVFAVFHMNQTRIYPKRLKCIISFLHSFRNFQVNVAVYLVLLHAKLKKNIVFGEYMWLSLKIHKQNIHKKEFIEHFQFVEQLYFV